MYLKSWQVLLLAGILGLTGCGKAKDDDSSAPNPEASPTPPKANAETFDTKLAQEYAQLPGQVLIGVRTDASGKPIPGSAEMRVVPAGTIWSDDPNSVDQAFDQAQPARLAQGSSAELDGDSSTQSWSPFGQNLDYSTYQPQAYSTQQQGYAYSYGLPKSYPGSGRTIYVYPRPGCTPAYCSPGTENPGPLPPPATGDQELLQLMSRFGVVPLTDRDFVRQSREKIELGARLFYDPLLSANGDLACASCHVERLGTANVYSLGAIGEVLSGRKRGGLTREDLLMRNAPALFNLGHVSISSLFWDGRVALQSGIPGGITTPSGAETPAGLDSVLAAQALFPLITPKEMGCGSKSSGSGLSALANPTQAWAEIVQRVAQRADYRSMLNAAYPEARGAYGIQHLVNAIAAFEGSKWRADNAPFDRYLRGDKSALSGVQKKGAQIFYGKAGCAGCHSGPLLTDQKAHVTLVPQFGPGAGDGPSGLEDYGFGRVTGNPGDRYKFRTPSLRNVTVTGPWGHSGAYSSLKAFVAHYRDEQAALEEWRFEQVILPSGFLKDAQMRGASADPAARQALSAQGKAPKVDITNDELDALVEFLISLTDERVARNDQTQILRN